MERSWLQTMDVFDEYERRFAAARAQKNPTRPLHQREEILESTKRMLRYREDLLPQIHGMEELARTEYPQCTGIAYRYETWPKCYGAATLYLPHNAEKPPLVFVCCGHGDAGRRNKSYAAMGQYLAGLGMAALVMDNIGQGDRSRTEKITTNPDHWLATAPFACGLTLQGLIVMETVAMIRYMSSDPRFDPQRFAACGNSGGGTLTMFLAALAPELQVIASSGYPSEIGYLLQKERRHCACNLLIGQAFEAEMWEIYSLFAPKPLLLSGGLWDDLIPADLAQRNARKVRSTYVQLEADDRFTFKLTRTKHSWEEEDIALIGSFLSRNLLGEAAEALPVPEGIDPMEVPIPDDCLTTARLSALLTGREAPEDIPLEEIFRPTFAGKPIDPAALQLDVGRGNVMRVFAQFESALYQE